MYSNSLPDKDFSEHGGGVGIDAWEQPIGGVDDTDVNTEAAERLREFATDRSGAQDHYRVGLVAEFEDGFGG